MPQESKPKRNTDYNAPFACALRSMIETISKSKNVKESEIVGELAEAAGATRQAISQYKNGVVAPNTEKLCQIADYFNVSTDFMLGRTTVWSGNADDEAINDRLGLTQCAIRNLERLRRAWRAFEKQHGDADPAFYKHTIVGEVRAANYLLENGGNILSNIGKYFAHIDTHNDGKEIVCKYYEAAPEGNRDTNSEIDTRFTTFTAEAWMDLYILNIVDALRNAREKIGEFQYNAENNTVDKQV